mmetsp:Transcript_4963/g.15064  ORF Transcript_4963/g.15064 Transcript_4963/m.15064 type:complete len:80 (+) Transcript_4963:423-662(+)
MVHGFKQQQQQQQHQGRQRLTQQLPRSCAPRRGCRGSFGACRGMVMHKRLQPGVAATQRVAGQARRSMHGCGQLLHGLV